MGGALELSDGAFKAGRLAEVAHHGHKIACRNHNIDTDVTAKVEEVAALPLHEIGTSRYCCYYSGDRTASSLDRSFAWRMSLQSAAESLQRLTMLTPGSLDQRKRLGGTQQAGSSAQELFELLVLFRP
jgi:hypothetical protein